MHLKITENVNNDTYTRKYFIFKYILLHVQLYTHTRNFVANNILLNTMHLVLLHLTNCFSRTAGDILSYLLLSSKRYLTINLINYKMFLFVHVSGTSCGTDETCLYDTVQTKRLWSSIRWTSVRPFQLISSKGNWASATKQDQWVHTPLFSG